MALGPMKSSDPEIVKGGGRSRDLHGPGSKGEYLLPISINAVLFGLYFFVNGLHIQTQDDRIRFVLRPIDGLRLVFSPFYRCLAYPKDLTSLSGSRLQVHFAQQGVVAQFGVSFWVQEFLFVPQGSFSSLPPGLEGLGKNRGTCFIYCR